MKLPEFAEKFRWPHAALAVCGLAMVAMVAGGALSAQAAKEAYDAESAINQASIEKLKSEIAAVEERPAFKRDEVADTLYSAQEAGNKVAMFQNEFRTCYKAADPAKALEINYASLMPLFDGTDGMGWSVWFRAEKLDDKLSWTFMTNYSVGTSSFPCTWFLRDGDGELVAYATADYDGKTGLFGNTQVTKTVYGLKRYTGYVETSDPGFSDFVPETPVDIPEGYHIDESGTMVDAEGNPYAPGEDGSQVWSGGFGETGSYSSEFADAVQARRAGKPTGGLSDMDEEGDARFYEAEG